MVIVIYGTGTHFSLTRYMKEQLLKTWEHKFLELTMIYVKPVPKLWPIYMFYQPIEKVFHEKKHSTQNSTLLPDKLLDVNELRRQKDTSPPLQMRCIDTLILSCPL